MLLLLVKIILYLFCRKKQWWHNKLLGIPNDYDSKTGNPNSQTRDSVAFPFWWFVPGIQTRYPWILLLSPLKLNDMKPECTSKYVDDNDIWEIDDFDPIYQCYLRTETSIWSCFSPFWSRQFLHTRCWSFKTDTIF